MTLSVPSLSKRIKEKVHLQTERIKRYRYSKLRLSLSQTSRLQRKSGRLDDHFVTHCSIASVLAVFSSGNRCDSGKKFIFLLVAKIAALLS